MKNVLLLEHYYNPDELRKRLTEWVDYYNHQRYHESLENVRPADAYWGHQEQIVAERKKSRSNRWPNGGKVIFSQKLQSM
ncbi:integrase core domain-containing protein [Spirosoma radiotolerans]|uniref:integrase core domain-containing protein n=1 Tax=Spirosoma radiotolerans TaxID=1379870 RepID=UPI001D10B6D5|nr:integrase core domain-containing protein [Spirosoma radiotolerans]